MREPFDVARSVQRWTAMLLPEPWNVRLMSENVNPSRPFVLISQNGTVGRQAGRFGEHSIRLQGAYTVHAYPVKGASREAAEDAAHLLESVFLDALLTGVVVAPAPPAGGDVVADRSVKGGVVPLWDFVGDTSGGVNPPRTYADFADVTDFQVRPIPDPADARLQTVVCDLRLAWWRSGAVMTPGTVPLTQVRVSGS